MVIPEELLKLSEKELQKALPSNPFKAKYLLNSQRTRIYVKKGKIGNNVLIEDINAKTIDTFPKLHEQIQSKDFISFTLKDLQRLKNQNLIDNLANKSLSDIRKYINTVFSSYYNEEDLDVIIKDDAINAIVHYTEVPISNDLGLEHVMKELYIKYEFSVSSGKIVLFNMSLGRTHFNQDEYAADYAFSHANGGVFNYTRGLCFGHDTTIDKYYKKLRNGEIIDLGAFLILVNEWLRWESLEGVPYRRISNIYEVSNLVEPIPAPSIQKDVLINYLIEELPEIKFGYDYLGNEWKIVLSQETVDIIDDLLTNKFPKYQYYLLNGESVRKRSNLSSKDIEMATNIQFKGKYITGMIYSNSELRLAEMRVHRSILQEMTTLIQKKLNNYVKLKIDETLC